MVGFDDPALMCGGYFTVSGGVSSIRVVGGWWYGLKSGGWLDNISHRNHFLFLPGKSISIMSPDFTVTLGDKRESPYFRNLAFAACSLVVPGFGFVFINYYDAKPPDVES
jgi:hypothetical protein